MHFSVLVPIRREDCEITQGHIDLAATYDEKAKELKTALDNMGRKDFSMEYELTRIKNLNSAYSVAIEEAVAKALDPYAFECEDPEFTEFYDETEDLKHSYEINTMNVFKIGNKYYSPYYDKEVKHLHLDDDGVVREVTEDGKHFLSATAKKATALKIPVKEYYKSFKKYANAQSSYHEDKKTWGYYYNPSGIYDWYSIGGRWRGLFLVKEDCSYASEGYEGLYDKPLKPAPDGYKWVSAARKKDIKLDLMVESLREDLLAEYNDLWQMWETQTVKDGYWVDIRIDGIYRFGNLVYRPGMSLDEFIDGKHLDTNHAISRWFHGFIDTRINPHEFPYHDIDDRNNDNDLWFNEFSQFLNSLDDDTVLVTVDIHS